MKTKNTFMKFCSVRKKPDYIWTLIEKQTDDDEELRWEPTMIKGQSCN